MGQLVPEIFCDGKIFRPQQKPFCNIVAFRPRCNIAGALERCEVILSKEYR